MILLFALSFPSCKCVDGLIVRERKLWPAKNSQLASVTIVKSRERKHRNKNATQLRFTTVDFSTRRRDRRVNKNGGKISRPFWAASKHIKSSREGTGFYLLEGGLRGGEFLSIWVLLRKQPFLNFYEITLAWFYTIASVCFMHSSNLVK